MTLIEKLTNELKKLNSNLGLSQEVLNSVASVFVSGLTDESTDEQVVEVANKALPMLKTLQSDADKIRTAAQKAAEEKFKGGNKPDKTDDPDMPAWFKEYSDKQTEKEKSLLEEIEKLKGENTKKSFDEMVDRVGSELGLSKEMLDRARRGLSSDMDENAVRDDLGSFQKALIKAGARINEKSGGRSVTSQEANKKEGEAYFEQLKAAMQSGSK